MKINLFTGSYERTGALCRLGAKRHLKRHRLLPDYCRRLRLALFLSIALTMAGGFMGLTAPLQAQPQVAASIRPLQLIAHSITDQITMPALVLGPSQDPHNPSLRPSERRALAAADLVLWIGPELETTLEKTMANLPGRLITARELPGLTIRTRAGQFDPHLWLDTGNARLIARALSAALTAIDPANGGVYGGNLADFERGLEDVEAAISELMGAGGAHPYAVYHDGLHYFEAQFGLQPALAFAGNMEIQPGLRQMLDFSESVREQGVQCFIVAPSINPAYLGSVIAVESMRYQTIDVLGHDVRPGRDAYHRFIHDLAKDLQDCRGNARVDHLHH